MHRRCMQGYPEAGRRCADDGKELGNLARDRYCATPADFERA